MKNKNHNYDRCVAAERIVEAVEKKVMSNLQVLNFERRSCEEIMQGIEGIMHNEGCMAE